MLHCSCWLMELGCGTLWRPSLMWNHWDICEEGIEKTFKRQQVKVNYVLTRGKKGKRDFSDFLGTGTSKSNILCIGITHFISWNLGPKINRKCTICIYKPQTKKYKYIHVVGFKIKYITDSTVIITITWRFFLSHPHKHIDGPCSHLESLRAVQQKWTCLSHQMLTNHILTRRFHESPHLTY